MKKFLALLGLASASIYSVYGAQVQKFPVQSQPLDQQLPSQPAINQNPALNNPQPNLNVNSVQNAGSKLSEQELKLAKSSLDNAFKKFTTYLQVQADYQKYANSQDKRKDQVIQEYKSYMNMEQTLLKYASNDPNLGAAQFLTPELSDFIMGRLNGLNNSLNYKSLGSALETKVTFDPNLVALIKGVKFLISLIQIQHPPTPQVKQLAQFIYNFSFLNPKNSEAIEKESTIKRLSFFEETETQLNEKISPRFRLGFWMKGKELRSSVTKSEDPVIALIAEEMSIERFLQNLDKISLFYDPSKNSELVFLNIDLFLKSILTNDLSVVLAKQFVKENDKSEVNVGHHFLEILDKKCSYGHILKNFGEDEIWKVLKDIRSGPGLLQTMKGALSGSNKAILDLDQKVENLSQDLENWVPNLSGKNAKARALITTLEYAWIAWEVLSTWVLPVGFVVGTLGAKAIVLVKEIFDHFYPWKNAGNWPEFYLDYPTFAEKIDLNQSDQRNPSKTLKTEYELQEHLGEKVKSVIPYLTLSMGSAPDDSWPAGLKGLLLTIQGRIFSFLQSFYLNVSEIYDTRVDKLNSKIQIAKANLSKLGGQDKVYKEQAIAEGEAEAKIYKDKSDHMRKRAALIALYGGILAQAQQTANTPEKQDLLEAQKENIALLKTYQAGDFLDLLPALSRTFAKGIARLKERVQSNASAQKILAQIIQEPITAKAFQNMENDLQQLQGKFDQELKTLPDSKGQILIKFEKDDLKGVTPPSEAAVTEALQSIAQEEQKKETHETELQNAIP